RRRGVGRGSTRRRFASTMVLRSSIPLRRAEGSRRGAENPVPPETRYDRDRRLQRRLPEGKAHLSPARLARKRRHSPGGLVRAEPVATFLRIRSRRSEASHSSPQTNALVYLDRPL